MGEIRTYIDPETGERFTGEVLEEYIPTERDRKEQEKYIRKYKHNKKRKI